MNDGQIILTEPAEAGSLGVLHLKRYWDKCRLKKSGKLAQGAFSEEWNIDNTLLAVLGLGLEQTIKWLYTSNADFKTFEDWIITTTGGQLSQSKIAEFNGYIRNRISTYKKEDGTAAVLTKDDIDFWNEQGHVIVRGAVNAEDCENTINAICDFINIKRDDAATWYLPHPARQGIMVQLFQHPALEKNRLSQKIRSAYEQLWERKDLWVNTDRVGFNPPETENWKFPGPALHWDVSLQLPIPFGLQGILYLSDTAANQGAFTLVPGFHHKIENWLNTLAPNINPRTEDIYALGTKPIVANAGDFIIWHQALPHGSSPNNAAQPRFAQYINYAPLDAEVAHDWK
jgi:Phytanoyl-CoA dioxygenase (PhyH)/Domain of unknown function (DUF5069)